MQVGKRKMSHNLINGNKDPIMIVCMSLCLMSYQQLWSYRDCSSEDEAMANNTSVKVFRIIPEFRILRLTFHRKSASKC